jgi:hypothetical protein
MVFVCPQLQNTWSEILKLCVADRFNIGTNQTYK